MRYLTNLTHQISFLNRIIFEVTHLNIIIMWIYNLLKNSIFYYNVLKKGLLSMNTYQKIDRNFKILMDEFLKTNWKTLNMMGITNFSTQISHCFLYQQYSLLLHILYMNINFFEINYISCWCYRTLITQIKYHKNNNDYINTKLKSLNMMDKLVHSHLFIWVYLSNYSGHPMM